jgi:hypothetical protein
MAHEDNGGALPPDPQRQRPAPTIDLKAKEISSGPAQQPEPEPVPEAESKSDAAGSRSAAQPSGDGSKPASAGKAALSRGQLSAIAAGAAALALFGLGLWLGGAYPVRGDNPAQLADRIGQLEATIAQLSAAERPARMAPDMTAALNRRIDELSNALREARARIDAAAADTAQGRAASSTNSSRAELDALVSRIAALEQSMKAGDEELAGRIAQSTNDLASRRAISAVALLAAVERGDPFAAELAAVKAIASDAAALAPLEAFAFGGVPSNNVLGRELSALAQPMLKTLGEQAQPSGILEKFQASAERLVRIRPVGETIGEEPAAIISRIELKAARSDIGGALQELAQLPANVRAPADAWIRKARTRDGALAASRKYTADALVALGRQAP